jgi:hypothetical protein
MPRLICVLPCENVIVSGDNKVSLISLIEGLIVGIPANAPVAPNTTIPMKWFAVCIFERQPGDEAREFETLIEMGAMRSAPAKFRFVGAQHRVIHQMHGLPMQFGDLRLRAYIGQVGQNNMELIAGDYPLNIQRLPQTTN